MKKLKINVLLNIFYQCFAIFVPLITAPYIARVVGVKGVGIYSYTYSIAFMFSLFILFGINNYGNRTISFNFDNRFLYNKLFLEMYLMQFFSGLVISILYFLYCFSPLCTYKDISLIQGIYVISAMFDISWFYFGLDKFKIVIVRSTIIKFISLISVFIFVKTNNDLWIYTLIMALGVLLGQVVLFIGVFSIIKFERISFKRVLNHIKPNLILFIPVISVSLYKIVDKIMISRMSNVSQTGIFENAEKIVNVPVMLVTAVGTVMLPFASKLVKSGNQIDLERNIIVTMKNISTLSTAIVFGLAAIGHDFTIVYYGKEFESSWTILALLLSTVFFISWANVIRTQYIIPMQEDNIYVKAVIGGAIINVILNLILIPQFDAMGAVFSTIASEAFVAIYQTFKIKNNFSVVMNLYAWLIPLLSACVMFILIKFVGILVPHILIRIIVQILIGAFIYIITMILFSIYFKDDDYLIKTIILNSIKK
ncbi:flippase [Streptococcus uberis]|nr:polysaccharide biosynthesis C-terminal domain-containing protein [Streptococcus uberis]MCK1203309.1 polysaccharide biosynthesis C-terminal domain-containing protein [Streptococcus uberis]